MPKEHEDIFDREIGVKHICTSLLFACLFGARQLFAPASEEKEQPGKLLRFPASTLPEPTEKSSVTPSALRPVSLTE
jgi:hypothetical protein